MKHNMSMILPGPDVFAAPREGALVQVQQLPAVSLDLQRAEEQVAQRGDGQGCHEERGVAKAHGQLCIVVSGR